MLTSSAQYRAALPYPHAFAARMDVYHDAILQASMWDTEWLVGGSVSANLSQRVSRSFAATVHPSLYPMSDTDLLSPALAVVRIHAGVRYPDGSSEVFPVFMGRIAEVERKGDGRVEVAGEDLAQDVVDAAFEQPEPSSPGLGLTQEFERLVRQALPLANFGTYDVTGVGTTPTLVWEEDRGQALDDLAAAAGARWYTLGNGDFVLRQYPYTVGSPVATLRDGEGGTINTAQVSRTRDGVANVVVVTSERTDGAPPVRQVARDTDPTSPTYYLGPYGKVVTAIRVQTPLDSGEALELAQAQLAAAKALRSQWSVSCVADCTLEPGDAVTLSYRGLTETQVIDSITYPLGIGKMDIATRSTVATPVEV